MSSSSTEILASVDIAELMSSGLAGPLDSERGTRKIHKRRLNRSSDEEHSGIALDASLQFQPDAFATIPDQLVSQATIEHVGFSKSTAAQIWHSWTHWPASGPRRETDPDDGGLQIIFLDFITGHISFSHNTHQDDDAAWTRCMDHYGLATELQHAILDPHFNYIRLSSSCAEWAKDTVEMRYAGLREIQQASRDRERALQRTSSRPGHLSGGSSSQAPASLATSSITTSSQAGRRSISSLQRQLVPGISVDSCSSTSAFAARHAPGKTVLYKAIDQGRITGLMDEQGRLSRIEALLSSAPTDFGGRKSLFYFTPDFEVAKYYAAYAKRRANVESVVMIRIEIPNHAIENMDDGEIQRIYWPNPEWKKLIWHCRTRQLLPKLLRKYQTATLIIGTISRKPSSAYYEIQSWEQVSESCVLKIDGPNGCRAAIQYVFSGEEEGEDFLITQAANSLAVFPFSGSELQEWMTEHGSSF